MYKNGSESLAVGGRNTDISAAPLDNEYVHDYSTGDFSYPDGREIVEVGPERTVLVRMSDIHELPQIRETITEQDKEDLAYKIIRDNNQLAEAETPAQITAALDLMHPPGLILLQPDELEEFLSLHADFYELDQPVVIPHNNRPVILRNEGHRRARALEFIIVKLKGLTLEDIGMRSNLHIGTTFPEANRRQSKENSHVQTSALEDAKNIIRQFKFIKRHENRKPSVKEIADIYGCSETKVRNALAFDSLPEKVQALVGGEKGEEQLPLSLLADLAPLQDLYDRRYVERMTADPETYVPEDRTSTVADEIERYAFELAADRKQNKSLSKLYEKLTGQKASVQEGLTIPLEQFLLFETKKENVSQGKKAAYRRFGKNCLYGIELAAANGAFDGDEIKRLEQLVELAKSHAQSSAPDDQEPMF